MVAATLVPRTVDTVTVLVLSTSGVPLATKAPPTIDHVRVHPVCETTLTSSISSPKAVVGFHPPALAAVSAPNSAVAARAAIVVGVTVLVDAMLNPTEFCACTSKVANVVAGTVTSTVTGKVRPSDTNDPPFSL